MVWVIKRVVVVGVVVCSRRGGVVVDKTLIYEGGCERGREGLMDCVWIVWAVCQAGDASSLLYCVLI